MGSSTVKKREPPYIDMKNLVRYKVDFVVSCGAACRPAYHIQMLGMRIFSSPCDWMRCYTLADYLEVMSTDAELMFREPGLTGQRNCVKDQRNGMMSHHDFDTNKPLEEQLPGFHKKMHRRAENTKKHLQNSSRVGLLMNRPVSKSELIDFCEAMSKMYPHCMFHVLNVRDVPEADAATIDFQEHSDKYTITQVSFNDAHKDGRKEAVNHRFWMGNVTMWRKILPQVFYVKGAWKNRMVRLVHRCIRKGFGWLPKHKLINKIMSATDWCK